MFFTHSRKKGMLEENKYIPSILRECGWRGKVKYSPNPKEKKIEKDQKFDPPFEKGKEVNKETSRFAKGDQGRYASLTHT
jgi:hypothetical protein